MHHRERDAVRDVETGATDLVGFNAPFTHRGGFPAHLVEEELGGDVLDIAGCDVDFNPRQPVRSDAVAVGVVEVGLEVNGVVRC